MAQTLNGHVEKAFTFLFLFFFFEGGFPNHLFKDSAFYAREEEEEDDFDDDEATRNKRTKKKKKKRPRLFFPLLLPFILFFLFPMTTTTTTTTTTTVSVFDCLGDSSRGETPKKKTPPKKTIMRFGKRKGFWWGEYYYYGGDEEEEEEEEAKIGFVATMGGLHRGHVSLIEIALERSDFVVVSVYVNPMQFAPNEDFEAYPRTLKEDVEKIASLKENHRVCVFAPKVAVRERNGPVGMRQVSVPNVSRGLCAATKAAHRSRQVVLKLLNIVKPDVAVFGRKDYQQLKVIEKMVRFECRRGNF